MLNTTAIDFINYITPDNIPVLIRVLALFGAIYLLSSLAKTGVNLFYFAAYIVGLGKWIHNKLTHKDTD